MTLREYMNANGLSEEQVSDQLSALLGRKVGVAGVRLWGTRKPPKAWAEALGLPDADSEPQPAAGPGAETFEPFVPGEGPDGAESPPRPPAGTTPRMLIPGSDLARTRIAQTYGLVGSGVSMATGNRGYSAVFDDCSLPIADAWIKAAEENDFCRRVVTMMSSGGATGELVVTHVVLLSGLLYVSGRIPLAVNPKWKVYGPPPGPGGPTPGPSVNGAGSEGAGDTVGQPGRPAQE